MDATDLSMGASTYDAVVYGLIGFTVVAAVWWHKLVWYGVGRLCRFGFGTYQWTCVWTALYLYAAVKASKHLWWNTRSSILRLFSENERYIVTLRRRMKEADTYAEWLDLAKMLDVLEGRENYKYTIADDERHLCDFEHMRHDIELLEAAMKKRDIAALKYLLSTFVIRNKHDIDSAELHLTCAAGTTKREVEEFQAAIIRGIEFMASLGEDEFPLSERRAFFLKLKHGFGKTALCLSGGGALAMYHMGIIRALIEADMLPNVISGSSGGAIVAGFVACRTNEELLNHVFVKDITVRYEPLGLRCFPPFFEALAHVAKTWYAIESDDFERITKHYYAEPMDSLEKTMHYTFQDAFLKTGRHVSITVSASDLTGQRGPRQMLLNHITTPNVLIWSAVATSCSLPIIMTGKKLMARDHEGNIVPYETLGKEWVDGSITHDLPMTKLASAFNATNFIASQVNPHIVPFVGKDVHKPTFRKSLFFSLETMLASDVRHRLQMLHLFGLVPKIYGQQFMPYLKQTFAGTVTLIPEFTFQEACGLKAVMNPTPDEMEHFLKDGERTVWPKLAFIAHLCAIEKALNRCAATLPPPPPPAPLTRSRRSSTSAAENTITRSRRSLTSAANEPATRSRRSLTSAIENADSKLPRWLLPLSRIGRSQSQSDRKSIYRKSNV